MPTVDLGKVVGDQGPTGERGSVWYTGTGITGTSSSGTVFPSSGIENSRIDDKYLNTNTNDIYSCIIAGDSNTAQWAWIGNIKGNAGPIGPAGPMGTVDENTPINFEEASQKSNIVSGESIKTIFGKIAKWFTSFGSAAWASIVNNGTTTAEGTVLDGRMGKTLSDSIGNLSNLSTDSKDSAVDAINELNGKLGSTEIERHAITLISEDYYELEPNYSWYVIKNGICYVQMQIRCKSPKSTSENYYPLTHNLPKCAMGDYVYDTLSNMIQVRVSGSGAVRIATGNINELSNYFKAYPIAGN